MLEIKEIVAENFYSLGKVTLPIETGLHYVVGINKDVDSVTSSSNGSGKTASFSAIYQGLFNKNIKNPKSNIEKVNNSITGKPYNISLKFIKNSKEYQIINDRSHNSIQILENGKNIQVKGITNQLKQIKELIGLDFETFSSLTYISQSTLQAILDTTNKDNILYQFFNVESIHKVEKAAKEERKELKNLRTIAITKLRAVEKSISLLMSFEKVDVDALEANLKVLTESALVLTKDKRHTQITFMSDRLSKLNEEGITLSAELSALKNSRSTIDSTLESLQKGVCPTCGKEYNDPNKQAELIDKLSEINNSISTIESKIKDLKKSFSEIKEKKDNLSTSLKEEEDALTQKINIIKSKLLVVAEQNAQYEKIKKQSEDLEAEKDNIYAEMKEIDKHLELIEQVILLIKNGTLVNEYLNKFRKVFVAVLKELIQKTDFNITTTVLVKNGKLEYRFFDRGIEKGYNDLSAGERTRVSLVLLISTIITLERVVGFAGNYLVIDEMLGVLDAEGIEMVKKFLDILRETKAVYLITHHEEIPIQFFDSEIVFEKEGGITSISSINKLTRN